MKINLMKNYPQTKRDTSGRSNIKTTEHQKIAQRFDKDFFDGSRNVGYGGFVYNPKWWTKVVQDFIKYYNLYSGSSILDVGCAKGFMLYDFAQALPGVTLDGVDISEYAIQNSLKEIRHCLNICDAKDLHYNDFTFDLVISINTVHNLELDECIQAIKEIERVGREKFITVDAWNTKAEEKAMKEWNLTAKTMMAGADWEKLFKKIGYTGDYYWFVP